MTVTRAHGLAWVEVGDDIVILDLRSGDVHLLDAPAAAVWLRLEGTEPDDLVLDLARAFDADDATVRRDLQALLAQLRDRGLVREATPG